MAACFGAQADRYRGLLLRQRDIMTALTGRLNERDEQLLRLQEEVEAYDAHQKCAHWPAARSRGGLLLFILNRLRSRASTQCRWPRSQAFTLQTPVSLSLSFGFCCQSCFTTGVPMCTGKAHAEQPARCGRLIRRLEDALDARTAELIALRKAAVEHAAASPIKSAPLQSALGPWASSAPSPLGCARRVSLPAFRVLGFMG